MSGELFYILVEGSPGSPELAFLENKVRHIFSENNIPLVPQLFEVGSSSSLSNGSLNKIFYKLSKIHLNTPVLAFADSDYRVSGDKKYLDDNTQLIKQKKAKVLYWGRHEWENYLLEETSLIADFVNKFPSKAKKEGGYFKDCERQVMQSDLEKQLEKYFSESIKAEFFECLKFNISNLKAKKNYPSIKKPENFSDKPLAEIKNWFQDTVSNSKITTDMEARENLYQEIMDEYKWDKILNAPKTLSLDFAKQRFRGKQSFANLVDFINIEFSCNINTEMFKHDLLKQLSDDSALVTDLKALLLKELP